MNCKFCSVEISPLDYACAECLEFLLKTGSPKPVMEPQYKTGEVWLCDCEMAGLKPREIVEISGGFVCYRACGFNRWVSAKDWHAMAQTKLGTVRKFLGIRIGITK